MRGPDGRKVALRRGDVACPVEAVRAWREAAGIVEGALFHRVWNRRAQRVGAQRLTPRIVANIVKAGVWNDHAGTLAALFLIDRVYKDDGNTASSWRFRPRKSGICGVEGRWPTSFEIRMTRFGSSSFAICGSPASTRRAFTRCTSTSRCTATG